MKAAEITSQLKDFLTFERTLVLIFLVSLAFRLAFLDLKLFHHDEAIHTWFSYRLLTLGEYTYDPTYHGPFLYYITAGFFSLFGANEITARFIPAILGSTLCLFVYPLYRLGYLNRYQSLVAALFFAISPDLIYFSRFLRNDIFLVFFTLVIVVAGLYYIHKEKLRYALIVGAAVGLGMSCKENMPVVIATFGFFILYLLFTKKWKLPRMWIRDLICAAAVAALIMVIFYSSFGAAPEMATTWWMNAIDHWLAVHEQQRLGGPPYIYICLFVLYELPIFILAIYSVCRFLLGGKREKKPAEPEAEGAVPFESEYFDEIWEDEDFLRAEESVAEASTEASGALPAQNYDVMEVEERTQDNLPETVPEPSPEPAPVSRPVDRKAEFAKFCIFWMIVSMAAYAYIGEKVPWLILHQLVPMILVSVLYIDRWRAWVPAVAAVFLIVMTLHVAFTPADINEPIVQVQNSEDLREIFGMIDSSDHVAVDYDERWPFEWYYYDEEGKKISYVTNMDDNVDYLLSNDFDLVIVHDAKNIALPGYDKYTLKKSYWFSIYDNMDRLIQYYIFRDGKMGSLNFDVFVRQNTTA